MQEWKELCYEWKIKFIINRKTESTSKIRNPQKQYASFKTKRNYSMQKKTQG